MTTITCTTDVVHSEMAVDILKPAFDFPVSDKWQTRQEQLDKWKDLTDPSSLEWLDNLKTSWDKIDLTQLAIIATRLRGGVACACSQKCAIGGLSLVFELAFEDGVSWIARVRREPSATLTSLSTPNFYRQVMSSEIAAMRYVKANTTIPVPEIYAFDDYCDNLVNAPYILMEGFVGRNPIGESNHIAIQQPVPEKYRQKYYSQLADIMLQLSEITFDKIGSLYEDQETGQVRVGPLAFGGGGPYDTAEAYYRGYAETFLKQRFPESSLMAELYEMMPRFTQAATMEATLTVPSGPPFPLGHGDFGIHNLIVDEEWNIIALVDWEFASSTPWEAFCNFPNGLILPSCPAEPPHVRLERQCFATILQSRQKLKSKHQDDKKIRTNGAPVFGAPPLLSTSNASRAFKCIERAIFDETHRSHYVIEYLGLVFGDLVKLELAKAFELWNLEHRGCANLKTGAALKWSGETAEFFRSYIRDHLE